jgi:gamma-butyrobetaine dioxygenase
LTSQNDGDLELEANGYMLRFPAVWLRDNCPCAECLDPDSGQKLTDITELPAGLAVSAAEDTRESVVVTYAPDGHRSTFAGSWLAAHALGPAENGVGRTEDDKELWPPADLAENAGGLVQLLHCLRTADAGGETGLVDGFAAARELRATDRETFDLIAGTPVPFGYRDKSTELRACQPLIQLSPRGRVHGVRFNNRSVRPPCWPGGTTLLAWPPAAAGPDPPRGHATKGGAMTAVETIGELFAGPGARDHMGEPVPIGEHMLQAGVLAEAAGAEASLVAAALLHDIGHLLGEALRGGEGGSSPPVSTEDRHGETGARWLRQWFGAAVTEPVRLHVAAKRYLCAADADYFGLLSDESVRTLSLQGGPMTAAEVAAFEALPHGRAAAAVRRWDDQAKDPAVTPPRFAHFAPLLAALVRT